MAKVQIPTPQPVTTDYSEFHRGQFEVSTRRFWSDDWTPVDYLYPERTDDVMSPGIGRAELRYEYGQILQPDGSSFEAIPPLDMQDKFVKVDLLPRTTRDGVKTERKTLWTGFTAVESFDQHCAPSNKPWALTGSGDQSIMAYSLDWMLNQIFIGDFVALNGSGDVIRIDRPLTFNRRFSGRTPQGNRSAARHANTAIVPSPSGYVFDASGEDGVGNGEAWTTRNIIEHLIAWYITPALADYGITLVGLGGQLAVLDAIEPPPIDMDLSTVKDVMDRLIDRHRGMGWRLQPLHDENDVVELTIYSAWTEPVVINGVNLPVTGNVIELDVNEDPYGKQGGRLDIGQVRIDLDSQLRFDRVVVRGEPIQICFTMSTENGNLAKGWTEAEETAYAAADDSTRQEDQFEAVYQRFIVPKDWDWRVGTRDKNILPLVKSDGSVTFDEQGPIRGWGHTMLPSLPLEELGGGGQQKEYRRPFGVLPGSLVRSGSNGWAYIHAMDKFKLPPIGLSPLSNDFGVQLHTGSNHYLGRNHFSGSTNNPALIDWEDLKITVAVEIDQRIKVIKTFSTVHTDVTVWRTLHIDVPDAHLWYIAANTVVKIFGDQLNYENHGTFERNDTYQLNQIAELVSSWYGVPRPVVNLPIKYIHPGYDVGAMLKLFDTSWQRDQVSAVITRKTIDYRNQETHVETNWGVLQA